MTALRSIGIVLFLSAISQIAAQVVVEDDIITDEVNFIDVKIEEQHSIAASIGLSLAVSGMGHYYIDKPRSAYIYMSIDAIAIVGAFLFNSLANQREKEARSFAVAAAGIESAPRGEAYWRHVGAFMGAAYYNEAVELSRGDADYLYTDPVSWWNWGSESDKDEFNDIRQKGRNMKVASSFFIGALIANKIVSIIDLRVFQKKTLSRGIRFESALTPNSTGASLTLKTEF